MISFKGRIFVGYPCVGKTSISGSGCVDLDSSTMFINPDGLGNEYIRPDGWEEIYINVAMSLAKQGYDVFLSSHYLVTKYLLAIGVEFKVICPSIELKDAWIERARNRYNSSESDKDSRALMRIVDHYEEDIKSLFDLPVEKIVIDSTNYDLMNKIK